MTLSHLRTQIRCVASDTSICRSLVAPLLPTGIPCSSSGSSSWGLWVLAVRFPHPRAIPKLILGHWYVSWSHASLANLHIRLVVPCVHPMRMCSIDSVVLHSLHVPRSSYPGIRNHTSPTIWVLWIALKRYCCALVRMVRFLMLFHIVLSVSAVFWYCWIAILIVSRFLFVAGRGGREHFSLIPLYAVACLSVASLAPCRLYSSGTSRGKGSNSSLFAPSFANLSLSSFPRFPLCPLTHLKDVVAVHFLSRYAARLKSWAFSTPIQPSSSHLLRCVVRPSMTYLESVIMAHDI